MIRSAQPMYTDIYKIEAWFDFCMSNKNISCNEDSIDILRNITQHKRYCQQIMCGNHQKDSYNRILLHFFTIKSLVIKSHYTNFHPLHFDHIKMYFQIYSYHISQQCQARCTLCKYVSAKYISVLLHCYMYLYMMKPQLMYMQAICYPLQWRHNEGNGVSNHQCLDCWLNTSKLWITGLCEGNSSVTNEFSAQRASNAENVSI